MRKYGYLTKEITESQFDEKLRKGELRNEIKRIQDFMGFDPTGEIDESTIERMNLPRCGFPDLTTNRAHEEGAERMKRFTLDGGRWEQTIITYRIVNTSADLPLNETRSVIRRSFDVWQEHIPKVFQEVQSDPADISILFATFDHGDEVVFDGPGGTLAHAYGPQSVSGDAAGDIHLDDSETFVSSGTNGTSLFWVASHEIGHSLGLGHSNIAGSLMWPYYGQSTWRGILNYDDKLGIQKLYVDGGLSEVMDSSQSSSSFDSSEWSSISSSFFGPSEGSLEAYESLIPPNTTSTSSTSSQASSASSEPSSQVLSTSSEPSSQVSSTNSEPSLPTSFSESVSSLWLSSLETNEASQPAKDKSEYQSETSNDESSSLTSPKETSEILVSSVSSRESPPPPKSSGRSSSSSSSESSKEIRKPCRLPHHRQHHRPHRYNRAHYVLRRPHRFND